MSCIDINEYCHQWQNVFFDKLADTSTTNRSLKEPFDLYWTVRLFHTIRADKSMTRLDFLKLFSDKALLEGYYQQFKEGRLTCNCLHCKLRSDCMTICYKEVLHR